MSSTGAMVLRGSKMILLEACLMTARASRRQKPGYRSATFCFRRHISMDYCRPVSVSAQHKDLTPQFFRQCPQKFITLYLSAASYFASLSVIATRLVKACFGFLISCQASSNSSTNRACCSFYDCRRGITPSSPKSQ